MTAIQVSNLHKNFAQLKVLEGINFTIQPGEGVVLLGANGCGKSTLMRCLNGLETPSQGKISMQEQSLHGMSSKQLRHLRKHIGVVFQQFNLVNNLSVFQNVLFGALGHYRLGLLKVWEPLASSEDRNRALECLERVGLAEKASSRCQDLSGGQQQRVAIARMLMQEPAIILADEPVASLDPRAGKEVMDLLWDIVQEKGLTLLCTLHQLELVREYGDRVLGLKAGKVALDAAVSDLHQEQLLQLYQTDLGEKASTHQSPQPILSSLST
ncbi:phosphonate ABC transporter ATP-binding protein [Marinospirillum sp.]|uniref:phosphonate ABC transporter ATP-binding protein n=1 Tax=Marinospirillum sp. TaxID=2183934 RepID=UPI0028705FC2|nr:phosphonate ABC transporter ATP-binding protein [Marinospirillum sp.]MDR9468910.1 phosphonate ABC transporter ATP-binding protein [Marinospirillum sp.]